MDETQKFCSKCRLTKPRTEFNFKYRAAGIRHSYCRECGKQLTQSHYQRNKQAYLERNNRTNARHRELIRQAKARPCADCGVQYPYYVMDFDHRDGATKSFMLSEVPRATSKSLLREIAKCDVVCANCHRERTHRRSLATGQQQGAARGKAGRAAAQDAVEDISGLC
ncbi:MAG TPA: hypothetical protein VF546_13005 [Pyrinomonadaceae bacterium]|jgi:hypothetical protein